MTQTIVITSGKGGVGKTNISVNTAIELTQRDFRTCLFDADLGLANVDIVLGIHPEYTLDDVILGDKNIKDIILPTQFGIDVIPGSSGIEKMANLDREEIDDLIESFCGIEGYDFFLIDTSSGISRGVIAFCLAGNETIIVITSESTSLTDAYALLKVMAKHEYAGTVKILVNKSPSIPHAKETYLRFKEVANRHLKIDIAPAGIILNDPNIERSVICQQPALILYPNSLASQCIKAMVSTLVKDGTKESGTDDFSEFWRRYFDFALPTSQKSIQPEGAEKQSSTELPSLPEIFEEVNTASPTLPTTSRPPRPLTVPENTPEAGDNRILAENQSITFITESIAPFLQNDGVLDVTKLSSPTPLLAKALELQARGELTQDMLFDIFSCDPSLMVRALKLFCAGASGAPRTKRVTTKHQLIEGLGIDVLTNLLSSTTMQKAAAHQPSPVVSQLATSFWFHSYQCALLAENIAEHIDYPFPEEAFIAGLIHDIGSLALQIDYPDMYVQFPKTFGHDEALLDMEQRIFTTTHAEMGAKALRTWNLDNFLVDAVQYHAESPSRIETAFDLVKIVYLACRLSHSEVDPAVNDLGKTLFELSGAPLHSLVANAGQATQKLADRFRIGSQKEMTDHAVQETESSFRHQAIEYSLLQGVLPNVAPVRDQAEIIQTVFQAFHILFNFRPAFCLIPDDHHTVLNILEYPDSFGGGPLSAMQFPLKWEKSLIVKSFMSGELKIAMDGGNSNELPLAEQQVLRTLGAQGFVCVPMVAHEVNQGVIVFGIQKTHLAKIQSLKNRLEQFGIQAGKNLYSLDKR